MSEKNHSNICISARENEDKEYIYAYDPDAFGAILFVPEHRKQLTISGILEQICK